MSASHNPSPDNGIKLLGRNGSKLSDEEEDQIEQRIHRGTPWKVALDDGVGTTFRMAEADDRYLNHLGESMPYTLRGISIALEIQTVLEGQMGIWAFLEKTWWNTVRSTKKRAIVMKMITVISSNCAEHSILRKHRMMFLSKPSKPSSILHNGRSFLHFKMSSATMMEEFGTTTERIIFSTVSP